MNAQCQRATCNVLAAVAAAMLLPACGDDRRPDAEPPTSAAPAASETPAADSCIAGFASEPCLLLTEALLRQALPDAPQQVEQVNRSGSFAACAYNWPSERTRTMKIGSNSVEVPLDNTISLSWIRTYKSEPRRQFRRAYLPTAEEQAKGKEMFAREFEKKAKEKGLTTQQQEIGQALADSAIAQQPQAQPLEGLGSMAAYGGNDLYVLDGNTSFQVSAEVSADAGSNREAATAIARLLLEACD